MAVRTVVVTGTSSGFGRAIVEEFAAQGWHVAATVRRREEHERLFAAYPNVRLFSLDVTNDDQVETLAAAVRAAYPRVDVLVNNAGSLLMGPLETSSMAQIRAQFETNVLGTIAVTKAFLPQLRAQRAGTIVNICSASALMAVPFMAAYGSSKWAIAGLSEALAVELAPFNIRVRTIFPGAHATPLFGKIGNGFSASGDSTVTTTYRPLFENFLATQGGATRLPSARRVARVVYGAATARGGRLRYVVGRDAHGMDLGHRLPWWLVRRLLLGMLVRSPMRGAGPLINWLLGGEEPVAADWSAFRAKERG